MPGEYIEKRRDGVAFLFLDSTGAKAFIVGLGLS